jgi:GNAT superfamily N-acetyltransferase
VADWLKVFAWKEEDKKARRQSRSNRRKTVLAFDEDEADRLVGFAAWRMKGEEEIDGEQRSVGEVRFMGVVPDRQGERIGSQLLANVLQVLYHEGGGDLMIRIDVDEGNDGARKAYESWGFEYYRDFVSGGKPYKMMLLRPEPTDAVEDEPASR